MTNTSVLDTNWIPQVAALGWLIITCASMISQNRMEITAAGKNMAKVVALNQWDAQNRMGQLEVFMTQWRRIEAVDLRPWPVHLAYFAQRDARSHRPAILPPCRVRLRACWAPSSEV